MNYIFQYTIADLYSNQKVYIFFHSCIYQSCQILCNPFSHSLTYSRSDKGASQLEMIKNDQAPIQDDINNNQPKAIFYLEGNATQYFTAFRSLSLFRDSYIIMEEGGGVPNEGVRKYHFEILSPPIFWVIFQLLRENIL